MHLELTFAQHPTEAVLEEYAFHRLSETATESVEEHLLLCEACQDAMEQVDEFIRFIRYSKIESIPAVGHVGGWRFAYGAASVAGIAALVVMGVMTRSPTRAGPVSVQLAAMRGSEDVSIGQAGAPLNLEIDITGLGGGDRYRVEVVDSRGRQIWTGDANASGSTLSVSEPRGLRRGAYWVRLYSGADELRREFGLQVQ